MTLGQLMQHVPGLRPMFAPEDTPIQRITLHPDSVFQHVLMASPVFKRYVFTIEVPNPEAFLQICLTLQLPVELGE